MRHSIVVENLSKEYRIGEMQEDLIQERLINWLKHPLRKTGARERQTIFALNDVSFKVEEGEVLGVVGSNGAGKSTLLKLLSKISSPTSGKIKILGRLAALLEVGTGFHGELTGRENIYLNASIMGMTKREVERKLDAIVAFAGVEKFIDTPVKHYSSGMYLRLGFSVAAHLEPDVLLVDEVLAVGDAGFQKKCLSAMDDLHNSGRTVLFVSHNMAAVENLCSRAIWIDSGRIRQDGPAKDVIQAYLASFSAVPQLGVELGKISNRRGNGAIRYTRFGFISPDGEPVNILRSGESVTLRLHYEAKQRVSRPTFEVAIHTALGTLISRFSTWSAEFDIPFLDPGTGYIDLQIDRLSLMAGRYYLSLSLKTEGRVFYDVLEHCAQVDVEVSNFYRSSKVFHSYFGLVLFPCKWKLNGLAGAERSLEDQSESDIVPDV